MKETITNCRRLVLKGKMEQAIDLLLEKRLGSKKEIYLISGRIESWKTKKNSGTYQDDFLLREENKIRESLLGLLESVEKKRGFFPPVPAGRKTLLWSVYILASALVALILVGGYYFLWLKPDTAVEQKEKQPKEIKKDSLNIAEKENGLPSDTVQGKSVTPEPERTDKAKEKEKVTPNSKIDNHTPPPVAQNPEQKKQVSLSRAEEVSKSIQDFKSNNSFHNNRVRDHINLGQYLIGRGLIPEGLDAMSGSIKRVKYNSTGYKIVSDYLIKYEADSLAKALLPDYQYGESIMRDDLDYKKEYEIVRKAWNDLAQKFGLPKPPAMKGE